MCGRFAMEEMLNDMVAEFGLKGLPNRELPFDWNIKPPQDIYIVKGENLESASWGLIAPWSKNATEALGAE